MNSARERMMGLLDKVYALAVASPETDVLAAAARLMENLDPPPRGCAYALVAAAAVMVAVRNEGTRKIPDEKVREALLRTRRQAVTALCGIAPCGILAAVTTCFRMLLGTTCPGSKAAADTAVYDHVARAVAAAGEEPDCRSYLWAALTEVPFLADKYLKINIPADRSRESY